MFWNFSIKLSKKLKKKNIFIFVLALKKIFIYAKKKINLGNKIEMENLQDQLKVKNLVSSLTDTSQKMGGKVKK